MFFNALFVILFMIVLNQQFAERDKAQELAENLESANAQLAANAAMIECARATLAESRAAIDDLRAGPANLAEVVREKIDRFTQGTGIPCDLEISIQENELSTEVTGHALGIVSEALMNITRHAQATQVHVRFLLHRKRLELEVRDNGKGFDVDQQINTGHYGLLGLRERARLTGGDLSVESAPQAGTTVRFLLNRSPQGAIQ
jgi:NarL family two-component system sensor histidine kinase YdfH